ncbi:MAG: UPF0179 family protein [Thermoplasmatales archaeon]|nr:UPF0179 family protein [Thermoplasmatales archaeon]
MSQPPVTLVGKGQAREGHRFYFMGDQNVCEPCKLKDICFNLEEGSLYEITKVRVAEHECFLNEGTVVAVNVEKVPFRACVPKRLAMAGGVITFETPGCDRMDCGNWFLCNPPNIGDGRKVSVESVGDGLECLIGESRVGVRLI